MLSQLSDLNNLPLLAMSDRQDLYSMAYIGAIVAASGFNTSSVARDRNSNDLSIEYGGNDPMPLYSRLVIQVKCTFAHSIQDDGFIHYPLQINNYNDLRNSIDPMILVVVLVPRVDGDPIIPWIECRDDHSLLRYRAYYLSLNGEEESNNSSTVTVRVPESNSFDIDSVRFLMSEMVLRGNKNP